MCEAIAPELFQPKAKTYLNRFSHHPSFKSLETSAHKGCNVCSLIYSSIYNKRHVQEYQCAGTGGPDDPPIEYSYSGLSGNSTVKEGHRTYISVSPYRKGENDRGYPVSFLYKIGQNGVTHEFDLEYSGERILLILPTSCA
jgi:hypothetical protein